MKPIRLLWVFAVMGTIFFLSSLPGDSFSLPDIIDIDKVLHALVYGVLALTVLFAIHEDRYLRNPWLASLLGVLFCLLFGISDEYHQSFVPYRTPSVSDLVADTIGAVIVVSLWFKWKIRKISCC
jgi:VanZ family protein